MRLRSVWINNYKNLKDFSISFEGEGFIDIFVGRNGSGKSNFLEALAKIFDHIYSDDAGEAGPAFDYDLTYEIAGNAVHMEWRNGVFSVDGNSGRKTIGRSAAPDHLLVYYSGQNDQVSRLVQEYEANFRTALRRANGPIAPKIIGFGPSCKKLLIVTMLMLPDACTARQVLCEKLGILGCLRSIKLSLSKPFFAPANVEIDPLDPAQAFWGVTGYVKTFLQHLMGSIDGEFTPAQLYDRDTGKYLLTCNIDKLRKILGDDSGLTLFRSLEALRVLGMLDDIQLPLTLKGIEASSLDMFSDGQFQSVYLFGIAELFKEKNCIALLDEPDAFLHPEWQFEFLNQVNSISEQAARTNHILLSSHSASTIAAQTEGRIRLFQGAESGIVAEDRPKSELIHSLSKGLITFSEQEAALGIDQVVQNANGPVLFTEGITDALILRCAWEKLNPGVPRPFAIEHGYGCTFLKALLTDEQFYDRYPTQTFFALFDFDDAFNQWKNFGADVSTDVRKCLVKQWNGKRVFGMLLPVPAGISIEGQVLKSDGSGHFAHKSKLSIELMFRDVPQLSSRFEVDPSEPGHCIRFLGKKGPFAQSVVPGLAAEHFNCFKPIFDFVAANLTAA